MLIIISGSQLAGIVVPCAVVKVCKSKPCLPVQLQEVQEELLWQYDFLARSSF